MSFKNNRKCNAQSKRTRQKCRNIAVSGSSKCRFHGGKSLRGIAHPNFKSGLFSRHLPTRLVGLFAEIMTDGNLIDLRESISLVDLQIIGFLQQLQTSGVKESVKIWKEINPLLDRRARFVKAEVECLVSHHKFIPIQQVFAMIQRLTFVVRSEIADKEILASFDRALRHHFNSEQLAKID
ncbi:MAG: hypothetical protein LUM44_12260 [Pyrinomonadaceae bacterium]|nr:hypothetical protein [Pyrinomonadaceae bacterium]